MNKLLIAIAAACALCAGLGLAVAHAQGAVTLYICGGDGSQLQCYSTIQAAVNDAPASGGVIVVPAGVLQESNITVAKDVTIQGAGPGKTTVQAAPTPCFVEQRVFNIIGANVRIENLTIRNGCSAADPAVPNGGTGGGIRSNGTLTLRNVVVRNNVARSKAPETGGTGEAVVLGGGIYSVGWLRVENSSIFSNVVEARTGVGAGGGWYNRGAGIIVNSTVAQNAVTTGATSDAADVTGSVSAAAANVVPFTGGGIENDGSLAVEYSTIVSNTIAGPPSSGGGIQNNGSMTLRNSLLLDNTATSEPDLACKVQTSGGYDFAAWGVNYYTKPGCGLVTIAAPPSVGILNHQDDMPVYVPDTFSVAVDGAQCASEQSTVDQLGTARPQGMRCDVGALELSRSFLALASKGSERPNLRVRSMSVEPAVPSTGSYNVITVIVENAGTLATNNLFWVDLYVNPKTTPPNYAGTPWSDLCVNAGCNKEFGVAWKVTSPLAVGETITLTTVLPGQSSLRPDIYIVPQSTRWSGYLPAGNYNVWALVDSWGGANNIYGLISEWNEFDNRAGPLQFYVSATTAAASSEERAAAGDQPILARPEPARP